MTDHLSQRELIEYQFNLASDEQVLRTADHLEICPECRAQSETLACKFSALDVLRDEPVASEQLITTAIREAEASPRKVLPFLRWGGIASGLIAAGLLLAVMLRPEPVSSPVQRNEEAELVHAPRYNRLSEKADKAIAMAVPKEKSISQKEKAPFAPASSIELVTLPRRERVQLTIYNSADLTLVRERRNLTLKKGWNWLQFMWAGTLIDPTSLDLTAKKHADKIRIQQLVFPPRLRQLGRWLIYSDVGGSIPFELTWFTSGLSWRAFYAGTLSQDERTMNLRGYVRASNRSGEDYENAQTRLIVGKVHLLDRIANLARRRYAYNRPGPRGTVDSLGADDRNEGRLKDGEREDVDKLGDFFRQDRKQIRKEGLSEYFLYTIEGTETIPNGWAKRLESFSQADIPIVSLYKYDEQRWRRRTIRFVTFANDEEHKLGQTPIPNGRVKIYRRVNKAANLSYVGGTGIKYIPVGEKVELELGPARRVLVEPKLMNIRMENYLFDRRRNIIGWDEIRTWRIEVSNARRLPVKLEITRGFGTAYWKLKIRGKEIAYKKHDASHARFTLNLAPRSRKAFNYVVRTYHGKRKER